MEKIIKYQCRAEKKLTNHKIIENEWALPDYVEFLECQSCGMLGIVALDKGTAYDADL